MNEPPSEAYNLPYFAKEKILTIDELENLFQQNKDNVQFYLPDGVKFSSFARCLLFTVIFQQSFIDFKKQIARGL